MMRVIAAALAVLLGTVDGIAAPGAAQSQVRGGVVPTIVHDLGRISEDATIERTVQISNPAPTEIRLARPVESCSACVHVVDDLSGVTIPPNGSIQARILVRAKGKRGQFRPWALFLTDSPRAPLLKVQFEAHVAGLWATDDVLNFGIVGAGLEAEYTFAVFADALIGTSSVVCKGVTGASEMDVVIEPLNDRTNDGAVVLARCRVKWRVPVVPGAVSGRIELVTEGGARMSLLLGFECVVVPSAKEAVERVYLGLWQAPFPGETASFTLPIGASNQLQRTAPDSLAVSDSDNVMMAEHFESGGRTVVCLRWRGDIPKELRVHKGAISAVKSGSVVARVPYTICLYPNGG